MRAAIQGELQRALEQMTAAKEVGAFAIVWVDENGVGFRAAGDEYHRLIGGMEVTKARLVHDLARIEDRP